MKIERLLPGLALIGFLLCISIPPVMGATFNVTNPSQFQTALTTAATNGQDDVINVAAASYSVTSTLEYSSGENYALTIKGAGSSTTVLDGGDDVRILSITTSLANANVTIQDLGFQNGTTTGNGGCLQISVASASVVFSHCLVSDCTATGAIVLVAAAI